MQKGGQKCWRCVTEEFARRTDDDGRQGCMVGLKTAIKRRCCGLSRRTWARGCTGSGSGGSSLRGMGWRVWCWWTGTGTAGHSKPGWESGGCRLLLLLWGEDLGLFRFLRIVDVAGVPMPCLLLQWRSTSYVVSSWSHGGWTVLGLVYRVLMSIGTGGIAGTGTS